MQTTLLSSKGQVIIPKAMREARHWKTGTRLEVTDAVEGLLIKPVQPQDKTPVSEGLAAIRRRIAYAGPARSVDEMHAAVLEEAQRRAQSR